MEISNNQIITFKNGSTIKTIQTDYESIRSSRGYYPNIIFNGFDLELCAYQKEFIKRILLKKGE